MDTPGTFETLEEVRERVAAAERLVLNPTARQRVRGPLTGEGEHDRHPLAGEVQIIVLCPRCKYRMGGPLIGSAEHGVRLWGHQRRYVRDEASGDLVGYGKQPPPEGAYFRNTSTTRPGEDPRFPHGRWTIRRVEWGCNRSCGFGPHVVDRTTADAAFRLAAHRGVTRITAVDDI